MSQAFKFGIDVLLSDNDLKKYLKNKTVALVAHPASVTSDLEHTLDALFKNSIQIISCYGPQHGMRGEKQYNMIESDDYLDPVHLIPVYSLYGKVRRPTDKSVKEFDVCLFDLQDVGCRIYTFLTTLLYMMEACHQHQKELWVLDRPNPAGRPIEGMKLRSGWESFVGAAPLPMRHGLTLGEMAFWLMDYFKLSFPLKLIKMEGYTFEKPWPPSLSWVNPSPNIPTETVTRCYPGTVLIEGTTLSEGRGTTKPLEIVGAPDLDVVKILNKMTELSADWMGGCRLRPCYFEPTFYKHQKALCQGFQIHLGRNYFNENRFKPYRLIALLFKAIKCLQPDYPLWRDFPYEYVFDKLAIDVINGSSILREWVDNPKSSISEFETLCRHDEESWAKERQDYLIYP